MVRKTISAVRSGLFSQDDVRERVRAKEREIQRLEQELADRRQHGSAEEVAALEFEIADLRVRGVEGSPIEMVVGGAVEHTARMNGLGLLVDLAKLGGALLVRKPRR